MTLTLQQARQERTEALGELENINEAVRTLRSQMDELNAVKAEADSEGPTAAGAQKRAEHRRRASELASELEYLEDAKAKAEKRLEKAEFQVKIAQVAEAVHKGEDLEGVRLRDTQELRGLEAEFIESLDTLVWSYLEQAREADQRITALGQEARKFTSYGLAGMGVNANSSSEGFGIETENGPKVFNPRAQFMIEKALEGSADRFREERVNKPRRAAQKEREKAEREAQEERRRAYEEWASSPEGQLAQARKAQNYEYKPLKEPGMKLSDVQGTGPSRG